MFRLNLVRNQLTEVPSDALLILKNLNQLDLSDNKISKLHQGTFEGKIGIFLWLAKYPLFLCLGLDKLDTLALNHNQLTALSAGDFEGLPRLTSLSLDYNKISYIDNEAFRGLEGRNEREIRQETSLIVVIVTLDLARDNYTIGRGAWCCNYNLQ